ncbi:U6 snRNA-associated Sm-like protein LSm4-like [Achlya hypogyna]|uniref:U6 snRNA-associated Sm-like protein LSm4 n=1 Tax=Achlya hypogyna TaxID=1202772 RepID=A0A1V9YB06_ACHHY|nr:U6 snRNA-associated Sm-like protein LSm4-like [Achlya hypogyna]
MSANAAQGEEMLVELKNGDTYNGVLVNCDTWMNVNLKNIICTSKVDAFPFFTIVMRPMAQDGDRFWKLTECYIRGNTIKYIGIPDKVLDQVNEEDLTKRDRNALRGRGRGGRGGMGSRGEGRGRGGRDGGRGGRGAGRDGGRGGGRDGAGRGGRGAHRGGRGQHPQQ